jgi:hypothetical protein
LSLLVHQGSNIGFCTRVALVKPYRLHVLRHRLIHPAHRLKRYSEIVVGARFVLGRVRHFITTHFIPGLVTSVLTASIIATASAFTTTTTTTAASFQCDQCIAVMLLGVFELVLIVES